MVQDQLWQNLGTKNIFDVKIYAYKLRTSDLTLKVYEPIWVTCSKPLLQLCLIQVCNKVFFFVPMMSHNVSVYMALEYLCSNLTNALPCLGRRSLRVIFL